MNFSIVKYKGAILSLALGVAVFLFWLFGYPQAMNYQEQNQLFLFSASYFGERMAVPGGLADWLSEFLVQFYYVPWLGALVLAVLAVAVQRLTLLLMWKNQNWTGRILSLLPVAILIGAMGDENVLLSYVVAIIGVLAALVLLRKAPWWADVIAIPVLYWLFGPMTIIYAVVRTIWNWRHECWTILWLVAVQLLAYAFILDEYPLTEVMLGINYYRIPLVLMMPHTLWIVPLMIILLVLLRKQIGKWSQTVPVILSSAVVVIAGAVAVCVGFPKDKYELLMQDYLVRNGQWQDIISRAEDYQVQTAFSSNAVNLALAMTNQLADRQFSFYQSGGDALIMASVRDNMSNLPSAEAFYRLGMINSAKRYMYDIQESIMNGRMSGRCMKRIAECFIINGQYKVAKKYLDVLKQSLFYSSWAEDAEQCLYNDAKVNANPEWGRLRSLRYKKNYLFDYKQKGKFFGLLAAENNSNKMAIDYFMAQMLLDGNVQEFMQYMGWVMQQRSYAQLPAGYADAVRCIQSHGTAPGSAYGTYVKKMMSGAGE